MGEAAPSSPDPGIAEQLEAARREGFSRGLSLGMFWVAAPCALLTTWRTFNEIPKFEEVFRQIKVPVPALTELVMNGYVFVGILLVLATVVCAVANWRGRPGSLTVKLNAALLASAILWATLSWVATYAPLLSLLQGIGQRRP